MVRPEQYLRPEVARRVTRLDLRAKFIVEGFLAGLHDSPYRGFSSEFSEHRKYVAGDDPRRLDWTAWAKSDRLFVKTYQAETNLSAYLLVDTSLSMAYASAGPKKTSGVFSTQHPSAPALSESKGEMTKLQYATALAAAIGYLLVSQHDAVGLGLLGVGLSTLLPPHGSRRQLVRVLSELAKIRAEGETSLAPGLHAVARRAKRRGLMILLSDLVDDPDAVLEGVRHLVFRGHDVIVFQILDPLERDLDLEGPVVLEDPETHLRVATEAEGIRAAYGERMASFVGRYEAGVRQIGADFAAITTSTPFDEALSRFLQERKRRF
ncbi:MAG TPA: DUF58 domain-containing protein [Phycisphaerae bacterium]|nr:DUF58 domain-containing protein [Phycisphaerae bacterium]